ncbi:hypothetical protein ABW19_dt0202925 [Dactylella cylindrospora]|nr:hypothetical protein ABW19_dt0202925 [Dactylella cylindrospora]
MSVLLFKVRRYRVLLLFSALVIALWYHYSPPDHDGTFTATDEWLQPSHGRGTTKEKVKSEWSPPEPDDAMPPGKDNPHGVPTEEPTDVAEVEVASIEPSLFVEKSKTAEIEIAEPSIPPSISETEEVPTVPVRQPSIHDHSEQKVPYIDGDAIPGNFPGFGSENTIDPALLPHWTKLPEHFPIPEESIIPLPTGNPKSLPRIQHKFEPGAESNVQRNERLERQGAVKDAFKHAWEGYAKYAWGHDEVMPVSGGRKDPFAGWAATLVDALDTMAIMGLHAEFEQALAAVAKIDFTTTTRDDIPMFETTIRYLGGLIGAYDVTGHKHKILIDKAEELAQILYNAFDTPNRMPVLYFQWQPQEVQKKHRASRQACMAELGSLSVEFTRLAQITGKNKYYDAIQRITNEFELFLNKTSLPGFWPLTLDASGCEIVEEIYTVTLTTYPTPTPKPVVAQYEPPPQRAVESLSPVDAAIRHKIEKGEKEDALALANGESPGRVSDEDEALDDKPDETQVDEYVSPHHGTGKRRKRGLAEEDMQMGQDPLDDTETTPTRTTDMSKLQSELAEMERSADPIPEADSRPVSNQRGSVDPDDDEDYPSTPPKKAVVERPKPVLKEQLMTNTRCIKSGFLMNEGENKYSYGGMSDSTYEYLLKEYILLGGLKEQYGDLYLKTYETGRNNLFFKPMTPKNSDILVSGELHVSYDYDGHRTVNQLHGDGSHLTCFVGGMVGMGSKIFDRPEDLEIAKKLTDGCVWNYFSTDTGIMPEGFTMAQCPKTGSCEWDENRWLSLISAPGEDAIEAAEKHNVTLINPYLDRSHYTRKAVEKRDVGYDGTGERDVDSEPPPPMPKKEFRESRESSTGADTAVDDDLDPAHGINNGHINLGGAGGDDDEDLRPTHTSEQAVELVPEPPDLRDGYERWLDSARESLKWSKMPQGYTAIGDFRYILRPEAIESVFYMYRITGDKSWQDKGWKMFQAVEKHTKTQIAHSAINNVLDSAEVQKMDSMESFWLAETLKYFYLLFSEPDVISLDEYVLNTEAHPLLRPKPKTAV